MKFGGPLNSETSYKTRMIPDNHDLEAVIRDLCVDGATWGLGAQNTPRHLKRTELNQIARRWHEFIVHNIMPTTNQSEITLDRAVLIHCIMHSQEVRVEKIIVDTMMKIIAKLHLSKPPLGFPNIIARLCSEMEVSFLASAPSDAVPKAKAITIASILAQNADYGPKLQSIERRQSDLRADQFIFENKMKEYHDQQREQLEQVERGQELMHQEFTNHVKDFSTRMDQMHIELEEEKARTAKIEGLVMGLSLDSRANDMYTHWGLQQCVPKHNTQSIHMI
ncbi:hypothetical protein PIB30_078280 [Stylosanthes scabra]|uniref:Putative plant transposon protein domain-containing protein n=1 Tax=Stylosanthes scabra TaxID=79078 RepID=A0ABU6YPV1_9FABA|nr:hypothetical protein [Stylosanthes scabra]